MYYDNDIAAVADVAAIGTKVFCSHWNYWRYWGYCTIPSSICSRCCCSYRAGDTATRLGPVKLFYRAVNWHDLSHQLVISRTNSKSFPGGADCPTCWVCIPLGRIS